MRIIIDAHMVGENETGNETYILGLLRGLRETGQDNDILVAVTDPRLLFDRLGVGGEPFDTVTVSSNPFRRLFHDLPRIISDRGVDVVHSTYMAPLPARCAIVVTIHDMCYRRHPEWFSPRDRVVLKVGIGSTVRRAKHVLTISESSKRDICAMTGLPSDRVTVAPLAVSSSFTPEKKAGDSAQLQALSGVIPPYVLSVGNLQPRKNLIRLLQAFAKLKEEGMVEHRLVIAGQFAWKASAIWEEVRRLEIEDSVVFTGYVPDADLPCLYRHANVFVYPSLFEGFGLPILEAMACGTPVVTSNVSSLPEVAGDAAVMVDPMSVESMAQGIGSVIFDVALRSRLKEIGLKRAASFSWADTARKTLEVYRIAAGL